MKSLPPIITGVLIAASLFLSKPAGTGCLVGIVTPHKSLEYVAEVMNRQDETMDTYIGVETINLLGKRFRLYANGKILTARAVDVLAKHHQKAHYEKFNDKWLLDLDYDTWIWLGAPRYAMICPLNPIAIRNKIE